MVRQVMSVHKSAKYLHIGCDEVFHIAACSRCAMRTSRVVFAEHVKKVARFVRSSYPGVTPLIWDDMMRHWSPSDLQESELGEFVEPMIWVYIDDIYRLVPHYIWYMYKKTFPRLWAASAFKGAFGETEAVPYIGRHFENNLSWLKLIRTKQNGAEIPLDNFGGIVLTGWSRYDHFAVLSELLPVGTPSLILNLALITGNFEGKSKKQVGDTSPAVFEKWSRILRCPINFPVTDLESLKKDKFVWSLGTCYFPGSNLYTLLSEFTYLKGRLSKIYETIDTNGWVSDYNLKYNYTNPWRVLELFPEEGFAGNNLKKAVLRFKSSVSKVLTQYYDNYTVAEWISQKVEPMEERLERVQINFEALIKRKVWERRPIRNYG